jgi:hypothetical protein
MSRTAIKISTLSPEAQQDLDRLYRQTRDVRLRTRAQIILLSYENSRDCRHRANE